MTDDDLSDLLSDVSDISYMSDLDDSSLPQSINVDLSNGSPLNNSDFTILEYNVNSILTEGRLQEISDICRTMEIDVLVCNESKLDENIPSNILNIPGYHEPIRRDRNRHGGGVMIYISESLTYKQNLQLQSENYEHIWVDVKVNKDLYAINALYRPPNNSNDDQTEFLATADSILTDLRNHKADKGKG